MDQGIIICDVCETSPVQMHCNPCGTNLCHGCLGDHVSTDTEKDHNLVTYKKKCTKLIFPKCETHKEQNCEMKCKQCETPVCVQCIASGFHKQHEIYELTKLFNSHKEAIKKNTTKLERATYPKYEEAISDLEIQIQNLPHTYDRLMSEIDDQGEEWHREVDVIINRRKQEVQKMKTDDLDNLKKLLEEMKNLLPTLRQAIMENNDILQSADVIKVLNNKYPEIWDPPPSINVTPPNFASLPIQGEQLHQMFGTLTAASMTPPLGSITLVEDNLATAVNQLQLLYSRKSPSSIHTGYDRQYGIVCLSPDEVWVCGSDSQIKRFAITGSLQETVTTTTGNSPPDITVSRQGDLIYTDFSDKSINRVRNGKIEKIISLQEDWGPMRVCCTDTDELLVSMNKPSTPSRVVHYSGSTEKQVIQFDDQGKSIFSSGLFYTLFIAENIDKDLICVSDEGTNTVVVFSQAGNLRFRYTGNLSSRKYKSFSPRGVVIDSMGHILVADEKNHCIHIIDQHGHFIHYIDNCQLSQPLDLSLGRNNTLYVAECSTVKVKVIKYLT